MTEGWVASIVLIAATGLWTWRLGAIRQLDFAGRASVAFVCGTAVTAIVMYAEALANVPWSAAAIALPMLVLALFRGRGERTRSRGTWVVAALSLPLVYGVLGARMTIGDLFFFWGPKAQHFFHARTIDVEFLKFPHYYLMHPDYPPLVPMVWAASSIFADGFTWWGPLLWTIAALIAATFAFRGFAAREIGDSATMFAALMLAIATFAGGRGQFAGGADPLLLMFEIVALSALTFDRARSADLIAAIALAGAAFTKVEGAAFVGTVVIALLLVRRFKTTTVAIPAIILTVSWILFAHHHGIVDAYGRSGRSFHFEKLGYVLYMSGWKLSYGAYWLPWIAAIAPLSFARSLRGRAAFPLLVAAGTFAYSILFYLNDPDPLWWIRASVERVMTTTLACLVVASAAASDYSRRGDGVVPQREEAEGSGREADRHSGGLVDQVR